MTVLGFYPTIKDVHCSLKLSIHSNLGIIFFSCVSLHPAYPYTQFLNAHKWMLTRLWKHPPEVWNTEHLTQALIAGITITIKQLRQHTVDVSYKSFQICIKQFSLCGFQLTERGSVLQHYLLALLLALGSKEQIHGRSLNYPDNTRHPGLGVGQEGLGLYLFTGCLHMDDLVSSDHVYQPFVPLSELLWIKCLIARFDWMWPEWESNRAWDLECILRGGTVTSAEIATEQAEGWIQMQARRRQQKPWRNLQRSINWIWMITAPAMSLCEDVTGSQDGTSFTMSMGIVIEVSKMPPWRCPRQ